MRLFQRFLIYAMLILGAVVFLLPLLWMISTGLKPIEQTMSMPPRWIPYKLFIEKDGQRIEVRRDDSIEASSYVVEIEGERHIVPQAGVANGQMTQQLPNGEKKVTLVRVLQEVPATQQDPWAAVTPVADTNATWEVVSAAALIEKVAPRWGNFVAAIAA